MGQPRKFPNEVELETYINDKRKHYFFFPVIGLGVTRQSLEYLQKLENIEFVNNGTRVFSSGMEKYNRILAINNEGDILGEIAAQQTIAQVAIYKYYSYKLGKTIIRDLSNLSYVKKDEKKEENNSSTRTKRKLLAQTTTSNQSIKKRFSQEPISNSAPVAQETKLIVTTNIAAIEQAIPTQDLFKDLENTMIALQKEAKVPKTSENSLQLENLTITAAHLAVEAYRDKIIELDLFNKLIPPSSTPDPIRFQLLTMISEIVNAGERLVPLAIAFADRDLESCTQRTGMGELILLITANKKILKDWLDEVTQLKQGRLPTSPTVPHGPLSSSPTTVTPISTGLTTPTTAAAPSTASPFSAGPSTLSPSPRAPTLSYSSTLFSPPVSPPAYHSPQVPTFLEEEDEEVAMTQEQRAIVASYLR